MKRGDIVQIVNEGHPWFSTLLIVDEVKNWGVQAYALIPNANDGSKPVGAAFNRLKNEDIVIVGTANILLE